MSERVTNSVDFYQGNNPQDLIRQYGSPLYVYNERVFREKCKTMKTLCPYSGFRVNYAIKANSNLTLMAIALEEGLKADVSSAGEIVAALAAGYKADDLFFIANNISEDEMKFAIDKNVILSVDSLSQLETYGRINRGGKIAVRFNTGIGGGHHEKVVTGGDDTKFGILTAYVPEVKALLSKYELQLVGINHHIGSQFAQELYIDGVVTLLNIAREFDTLEFVDFGGGFYIPYHKQDGEKAFDLKPVGKSLAEHMQKFSAQYGKELVCMIEPGRFIAAECGVLLGTVHAVKKLGAVNYAGTDMGFSVFARPTLYDSHHDVEVYRDGEITGAEVLVNIVGNQCESGDYIANKRLLPPLKERDVLGVLDTGAYGFSMSSQYNHRQRPAEVLIRVDGSVKLIRRRETYEEMLVNMQGL
ncbi:MAG: diaminopimelate decarboxylase [Oscillospiraceae bacterium]|nr:diaminopimelate decarboxylase [Oscillospiraceae bacterium]